MFQSFKPFNRLAPLKPYRIRAFEQLQPPKRFELLERLERLERARCSNS
jgi:hypothetical protein